MDRPRLRKIHRIRCDAPDGPALVLHDPLGIADPVTVPAELSPLLDRLDGSRTVAQIRQSLALTEGLTVDETDLLRLVEDLSAAGLLRDEAFAARAREVTEAFDGAEVRPPCAAAHFGGDPPRAEARISEILPGNRRRRFDPGAGTVGVVTPHLPPGPAREVLDATLQRLPPREGLDLVVVLGTDAQPGRLPFTLCPKSYGTALGPVPLHAEAASELVRRVPWIDREALRHRRATSVEVACTLLCWLYAPNPPPILPILVTRRAAAATSDLEEAVGALAYVTAGRGVLWWASAELSHTGPDYGRSVPLGAARRSDMRLVRWLARGDPDALPRAEAGTRAPASGAATLAAFLRCLPAEARLSHHRVAHVRPASGVDGYAGLLGARFCVPSSARVPSAPAR